MLKISNIGKLVSTMDENTKINIKKLKKFFGNLKYVDDSNQSLLHILVDNKYDENKCFLAIKSLLQTGLSPNLEDFYNYNFIQTALYAGYSEDFIIKIIKEALKYNLDVNHVDSDKDTIVHTAIYSDNYLDDVINIYKTLIENGFDSSKIDHDGRNLVEAMIYQNQYSKEQIEDFSKLFLENTQSKIKVPDNNHNIKLNICKNISIKQLSDKEILELEKCGQVLNKKQYFSAPTIGREMELKNLFITLAQEKKNPLIVGESGVGKTALVDELVYRIQNGQVPSFLSNKIILEVTPSEVVSGCSYVGQFEESMINLMKICKKYDVILFIDRIHTIYGIGTTGKKDNDMAAMLKHYLDRTNLKVIGITTTDEYSKFFSNDDLKRSFEKISVKEPNPEILVQIIDKVIEDYYLKNGIAFKDEQIKEQVVNIIVELTSKKHRDYQDIINNPDLSISIIDKAFAIASVYDSEFIDTNHFIESLEYCDRLSEFAKNQAINKLKNIVKPTEKVLTIDFKNNRK